MDKTKLQKYINPITFEAEMFVNSLESLSEMYNNVDAVLVSSLEKVMNAIEKFLDSSGNEILATETTKLMPCDDINHIIRIYHCSRCKTDLGKSVEKVTSHLIKQCEQRSVEISQQKSRTTSAVYTGARERKPKNSKFEKRSERKDKKREERLSKAIKLTKKTHSLLTTNLEQFFTDQVKIGMKLKCIPDYDVIENDLMNVINPLFPDQSIKIYRFGSRIAGIGSRESDLDLFIDIGDNYNKFENRADSNTVLKLEKVSKALSNKRQLWKGMILIDKARVPILRIIHASTSIECDINLSNSLGDINTKFLEFIFTLQPMARLMCIYFKKWLNRINLNKEISTYSIILMVIFYLQTLKVLPSVESLQQNVNAEKALTIGPWLCSYATLTLNELNIPLEDINQPNLLKFITDFFLYYKSFRYDEYVICPYLGRTVKRNEIEDLMPNRYTNYVNDSLDYALELDKSIVIQDPIQLNHNVTKSVSVANFQVFRTCLANSFEVLKENFLL